MTEATLIDAFNLLCGDLIGEGSTRKVYECRVRPDLVVKVEGDDWRGFANVIEQKFWDDHCDHDAVSQWLAPCRYLSPDGRILMQDRADPVSPGFDWPDKVPSFLTDKKRENFGLINGRLVCVDYALTVTSASTRLRAADWWSLS